MGHQRHFDRVRGLVSGQTGVPEAEITLETRLVEDLGMDGDDGHELLEVFADEFGVDLSQMAPFNYFDDEPPMFWFSEVIPILAQLSPRFRRYVLHVTRGRRAVTLRDLVASARAGRWIRPAHQRTDLDPLRVTWRTLLIFVLATPLLAFAAIAVVAVLGGPADRAAYALAVVAIVLALIGGKVWMAFHWLRRLDAAATFEEKAASAAG